MRKHILKTIQEQRMAGYTFLLTWKEWERYCAEHDVDSHKCGEHILDLGDGASCKVAYIGENKEKIIEKYAHKFASQRIKRGYLEWFFELQKFSNEIETSNKKERKMDKINHQKYCKGNIRCKECGRSSCSICSHEGICLICMKPSNENKIILHPVRPWLSRVA